MLAKNAKQKEMMSLSSRKVKAEKCDICRQCLDNVLLYPGHPNDAEEEYITLINEKLILGTENENIQDDRPVHKITHFSIYDKNGHLCPFDGDLIDNDENLYFSGFVKPIFDEDTSPEDGLPTKDMGPINEWFISGFDGGESALIAFSTQFAEYYLQTPAPAYESFMIPVRQKINLTKLVIEFLLEKSMENPTYEDLVYRINDALDPDLTEETLLLHAQFICDKVLNCDLTCEADLSFIVTPCMRTLIKLAGVTFKQRKKIRSENKSVKKSVATWSKATTTKIVREIFENFFVDQLDNDASDGAHPKRKRCGVCEACQTPDCGKCTHCRDMIKFGGGGRSKQACHLRKCPYMAIEEAEDNSEGEEELIDLDLICVKTLSFSTGIVNDVEWMSEFTQHEQRKYYTVAKIGDVIIESNDFVMLNPNRSGTPLLIAKVAYMWEELNGAQMFHAHLYCRGIDTILGETADPRELFVVNVCENSPLGSIVRKANVYHFRPKAEWKSFGGIGGVPIPIKDDQRWFYYSKRYYSDRSRFEDFKEIKQENNNETIKFSPCDSCNHKLRLKRYENPIFADGIINWRNNSYRVGDGVFLKPGTFQFKPTLNLSACVKIENVDDQLYPEFYRKTFENMKVNNMDAPQPFCIGLIENIQDADNITVRKFYRPENTHKGIASTYHHDLNYIYWSHELQNIKFASICGKCYIEFSETLEAEDVWLWTRNGPYRFYFDQAYNEGKLEFMDVPQDERKRWQPSKGKITNESKRATTTRTWKSLLKPLKSIDVFSGCGGLSEGLHQSGVCNTLWAIEKDAAAAKAFKLNNPNATVYTEDCNELLRLAMSGESEFNGKPIPQKGEVEMMVGGPPCQGFSGMNRFNTGQYSLFKNSLIVSYLSYCDYYRPNYFLLENVRNFVSFKRGIVLKLTIRCLLAIGYQVAFGILQAGHYGVPQTRRRFILMAAAPGYNLPNFPNPANVFSKRACQLLIPVDGVKYQTDVQWLESAPYRTITVKDALGDLPPIPNGFHQPEIPYDCDAISYFQKTIRDRNCAPMVKDHICKEMCPLVELRISQIPFTLGADWRDLPNISLKLRDGNTASPLIYSYYTRKQSRRDPPRGVCQCATGKACAPTDKQYNTLIPWCLPHTADRHNNWAGLYGRLDWNGYFSTTVTNPEPMGKQGRVLHPEQHRVVSVRECARSQGFPDRYQFYGSILDKHKQIGNAVPPPLALAIGRQIIEALETT